MKSELEQEFNFRKEMEFLQEEQRYFEYMKQKQRRTWLSVAFTCLALAYVVPNFFHINIEPYRYILYVTTGLIIAWTISNYLSPEKFQKIYPLSSREDFREELSFVVRKNKEFEKQNLELRRKLDQIITQIQKGEGGDKLFSAEDKQNILNKLQAKLESESLEEYKNFLVSLVENKLTSKSHDSIYDQTSNRIEAEILNQSKRGNVNLILGIITTLTGVTILGYSVFNAPSIESTISLASHFIPRVSLVLLIEVFAYFFLKLYKQSLSEIKYFQNELTNVENKYLAVKLTNSSDKELLKFCVHKLAETERNFVLEKGQTTVDLEKDRIDLENNNRMASLLEKAIGKIKS